MGETEDHVLLRRYLLGDLSDDELRLVEERLVTEDDFFKAELLEEDDLIDEYVQGLLTDRDREAFERCFVTTAEARLKVDLAASLQRYATVHDVRRAGPPSVGTRRWRLLSIPYLRAAAAVITVAGCALVVWLIVSRNGDLDRGIAALRKAHREARPTQARITGFVYAPFHETRGPTPLSSNDRVAVELAERMILTVAVDDRGSPKVLHALGQLYLSRLEFARAATELRAALEKAPDDPGIHSDLGAALLEQALQGSDGQEVLGESLTHLTRAIELDGSLREARFNRAVCNEALKLWVAAEEDWQRYVELDPESQWAEEAKAGIQRAEQHKTETSQGPDDVFRNFLNAWLEHDDGRLWEAFTLGYGRGWNAVVGHLVNEILYPTPVPPSSENADKALTYLGEMAGRHTGDQMVADIAHSYRGLRGPSLAILRTAHQDMASGTKLYGRGRRHEAMTCFARAETGFERAGDSCHAMYALSRRGHCLMEQGSHRAAIHLFEKLIRVSKERNYLWMRSRAHNSLAQALSAQREYSAALDHSKEGIALSRVVGDQNGLVRGFGQAALICNYLGDWTRGLGFVRDGMAVMERYSLDQTQVVLLYDAAADLFTSRGERDAAIGYHREALRRAIDIGHKQKLAISYALLGMAYGLFDRYEEAFENLHRALDLLEHESSSTTNEMAFTRLRLAHLYRRTGKLGDAIAEYDASIKLLTKAELESHLFQAHLGKMLCGVGLGDDKLAQTELAIAVRLIEENRSRIASDDEMNKFLAMWHEFAEAAVSFAHSRLGNPRETLELAESFKARSLLDLMGGGYQVAGEKSERDVLFGTRRKPPGETEIRARLPERVQLLEYAVLNDRVLIWLLSKDGFIAKESRVERPGLESLVRQMLEAVGSPDRMVAPATELYSLLIEPVSSHLVPDYQVCVVPDSVLTRVPFAALVSPSSGRYLLQDYVLSFAPSAAVFLRCSEIARSMAGERMESVLSVGDPSYDPGLGMTRLRETAREAQEVRALYSSGQTLLREQATERNVVAGLTRVDVVNLASHYVVDAGLMSRLLLAPAPDSERESEGGDGRLHAYEMYSLRPARTRVAVLSGCQTALDRYYEGEGAVGAARPFIAAGVPLVVASLWPVDSAATADLIVEFHRRRTMGTASTAQALRSAQIAMLNEPGARRRAPYYWAAFSLIGGHSSF